MAASDRHSLAVTCDIYEKCRKYRETIGKNGEYLRRFLEIDDGATGDENFTDLLEEENTGN